MSAGEASPRGPEASGGGGRSPPAGGRGLWRALGALLCALALGYALLLHHGLGPPPMNVEGGVASPTGFLLEALRVGPLAELTTRLPLALGAFGAPALVLALAVFLATPSGLARWLATSALLAGLLFVYYGLASPQVWAFFHWRWSACLALGALAVGGAACAPLLVARARRLPLAARAALGLVLLALVLVLERDLTGTDPSLPFALSPWPVLPVFALDVAAFALACAFAGAAAGLALPALLGRLLGGAASAWAGALLALPVAAALPAAFLALASLGSILPYDAGRLTLLAGTALGLLALAITGALAPRGGAAWGGRARTLAAGALLVALPIAAGRAWVALDYAETREERAGRIIAALERHYAEEQGYPDRLAGLVEAGLLERVPRPAVGFGIFSESEFTYQDFGNSYLLEFSAPRWVQCAFNPPYPEAYDGPADRRDAAPSGSWSCPSEPPELW